MNIKEFIHGDMLLSNWMKNNIMLILLVAVLLIFYITNRYSIEVSVKKIDKCSKEIKELQQHSTKIKTMYQKSSMMLILDKKLAPIGVGISKEPIKEVIVIENNE